MVGTVEPVAKGVWPMIEGTTPDTFSFMVLGYAVILGTMAAYILSLVLRHLRVNNDLRLIEGVEAETRDDQGN
ncbi:MAG: hypothetical protein PVI78_02940 [Anaerolineales bacterium]|jgi:hypothetical protein